eukprot:m.18791 g.18791  ORF g.18791 m.18791 type:complete len:402 (+) comp9736_c0_seq1:267-1472(+)
MPMFIWARSFFVAKSFRSFREGVLKVASKCDSQVVDGDTYVYLYEMVVTAVAVHPTDGTSNVKTNCLWLSHWAWAQLIVAVALFVTLIAVTLSSAGNAAIIGGGAKDGRYQNHYNFECPMSCSVLTASPSASPTSIPTVAQPTSTPSTSLTANPTTAIPSSPPTAAPTTDDIQCRIRAEGPAMWWSLFIAFGLNFTGALLFCGFARRVCRKDNDEVTVLMTYAAGDGRNLHFSVFKRAFLDAFETTAHSTAITLKSELLRWALHAEKQAKRIENRVSELGLCNRTRALISVAEAFTDVKETCILAHSESEGDRNCEIEVGRLAMIWAGLRLRKSHSAAALKMKATENQLLEFEGFIGQWLSHKLSVPEPPDEQGVVMENPWYGNSLRLQLRDDQYIYDELA